MTEPTKESNAEQMARLAEQARVHATDERPDLVEHYARIRDYWRSLASKQS
jgi:hypothetical protein